MILAAADTHPLVAPVLGRATRLARAARGWAVIFALWTAVGLLTTEQTLTVLSLRGLKPQSAPLLLDNLANCWIWALLTPAIAWCARRWTFSRSHWVSPLLLHVAALAAVSLVDAVAMRGLVRLVRFEPAMPGVPEYLLRTAFVNTASYVVVVAITTARRFAALYTQGRVESAELEAQLARAQLVALQSQIRPHFLFNTLNAIAEQLHRDPDGADRMIARLATLLRASFGTQSDQEVSLRREIDLARAYVDLMSVRLGDRFAFTLDVDRQALDALVPAFLLQPLLENAIRHGIEPLGRRGQVALCVSREPAAIRIEVRDDGMGLAENPPEGVGLRNTRSRLRQLYGRDQELSIRSVAPGGGTLVEIRIPYRTARADERVT